MSSKTHGARFIEAMVQGDSLAAVLRGHLHIERAIRELILLQVPGAEPILHRMMFKGLLSTAWRMKLFDKPTFTALEALNTLRNTFAHELERDELTEQDDKAIVAVLSPAMKHEYDRMYPRAKLDEKPGKNTRLAITAMLLILRGQVADTKSAKTGASTMSAKTGASRKP
jgi:hypothetical protein